MKAKIVLAGVTGSIFTFSRFKCKTMSDSSPKIIDDSVTASDDSDFDAAMPPPDASFETLLTMLFTQGMAALGQLPGGPNEKMPINKPFAKHFIDTIEMLGEKTKGNLSDEEQKMHSEVLHALRITFVSVKAPK